MSEFNVDTGRVTVRGPSRTIGRLVAEQVGKIVEVSSGRHPLEASLNVAVDIRIYPTPSWELALVGGKPMEEDDDDETILEE